MKPCADISCETVRDLIMAMFSSSAWGIKRLFQKVFRVFHLLSAGNMGIHTSFITVSYNLMRLALGWKSCCKHLSPSPLSSLCAFCSWFLQTILSLSGNVVWKLKLYWKLCCYLTQPYVQCLASTEFSLLCFVSPLSPRLKDLEELHEAGC